MTFNSLIQLEGTDGQKSLFSAPGSAAAAKKPPKKAKAAPKKRRGLDMAERGCQFCPANKAKGIHKLKLPVTDANWLIVFQSPGPRENNGGSPWGNPAAAWLAGEMKLAGISRKAFDVQYAVRCMPADVEESSYDQVSHNLRKPLKEEEHCCSLYTEEAIAASKAKQIILVGAEAAKLFLATKSLPKQKVFWSDAHKARIYILTHPAFFMKGYGQADALNAFRQMLSQFKKDSGEGVSDSFDDPYAYIRKQNYQLVLNSDEAAKARQVIREYAYKRILVGVDIEYDEDKLVSVAFSYKPGHAAVFVVNHPEQKASDGAAVFEALKELLEDDAIKKAFHYGCSDGDELRRMAGIELHGYVEDTYVKEYLRFLDAREYGLEAISNTRFLPFAGYKYLIADEMLKDVPNIPARILNGTPKMKYDYVSRNGLFHISKVSLDTLRLYNGADSDLTKRLQVDGKGAPVPPALQKLYIDLNFVLRRMEPNGPDFDYEQNRKLAEILPMRADKLRTKLCKLAKSKDFNPGSPAQVEKVLFEDLKLEYPFDGKRNTRKMTLLAMSQQHPMPLMVIDWRKASKAKSTYVDGYLRCARANKDRLRTKWNSTGTRTGRLSSGGDKKGTVVAERTMINLQNIHGDPQMKNMCVADRRWRRAFKAIYDITAKERYSGVHEWLRRADGITDKDKREKAEKQKPSESIMVQWRKVCREIESWIKTNAPDLKTFLVLDYGQIEVRVAAQLANDKNLIKDCLQADIHTTVGVAMTGWDADKIKNDKATRTLTKNVHFGVLFGIGKAGLYNFVVSMSPPEMRDSISREMVDTAYDRYFARYKGIGRLIEAQRAFVREYGYCETIFGMRRYLEISDDERKTSDDDSIDDEDESYNIETTGGKKAYWANVAVNTPIQGSAHQLMICALVNFYRDFDKYKVLDIPVMDVHDALYFRVNVFDLSVAYPAARNLLEHQSLETMHADFPHIEWKVPIVTEAEAGLRLGSVVSLDEKLTAGDFMLRWYDKTRRQSIAINKEYKLAVTYNAAKSMADAVKVSEGVKAKKQRTYPDADERELNKALKEIQENDIPDPPIKRRRLVVEIVEELNAE